MFKTLNNGFPCTVAPSLLINVSMFFISNYYINWFILYNRVMNTKCGKKIHFSCKSALYDICNQLEIFYSDAFVIHINNGLVRTSFETCPGDLLVALHILITRKVQMEQQSGEELQRATGTR